MLLQHLLEIPARMTGGMLSHLFWGARDHDLSSLVSPFWAEIHDPVGTADQSRLCSITKIELPLSTSRCITSIILWMP